MLPQQQPSIQTFHQSFVPLSQIVQGMREQFLLEGTQIIVNGVRGTLHYHKHRIIGLQLFLIGNLFVIDGPPFGFSALPKIVNQIAHA